jgi:hypothetical protein
MPPHGDLTAAGVGETLDKKRLITSVRVGAFIREDGEAAPHRSHGAGLGRGNGDFRPGTEDDYMQCPVEADKVITFPPSPHRRGWDGSYTAPISVVLDDGSRHALGYLKWVCFEDAVKDDCNRSHLDELELKAWAITAGFRVSAERVNAKVLLLQCPPSGFTPPSDTGSTSAKIDLRQSLGIELVPTYLPIMDFVTGFAPRKRCSQYVLQDAALVLPEVVALERVVEESAKVAASKLEMGIGDAYGLESQELFAIVLYSFDLSLIMNIDNPETAQRNFYYQLNLVLQTRNAKLLDGLRGYLFFLSSALQKLECVDCELYRGIRRESLPILEQHYKQGRRVHWSGMTSTSKSFNVARSFAGHEGVVLRIAARSGRRLGECSAMGEAEQEILLMPNFKAAVVKEIYRDTRSGVRCIDLVELANDATHVF